MIILLVSLYVVHLKTKIVQQIISHNTENNILSFAYIDVREYWEGNQQWTIQRNWQHRAHKTKENKAETRHNPCWTPLCAYKHKQREQEMRPPINNWRQRRTDHRFYADIETDITAQNSEHKDTPHFIYQS
jgi:hypothetical protein